MNVVKWHPAINKSTGECIFPPEDGEYLVTVNGCVSIDYFKRDYDYATGNDESGWENFCNEQVEAWAEVPEPYHG